VCPFNRPRRSNAMLRLGLSSSHEQRKLARFAGCSTTSPRSFNGGLTTAAGEGADSHEETGCQTIRAIRHAMPATTISKDAASKNGALDSRNPLPRRSPRQSSASLRNRDRLDRFASEAIASCMCRSCFGVLSSALAAQSRRSRRSPDSDWRTGRITPFPKRPWNTSRSWSFCWRRSTHVGRVSSPPGNSSENPGYAKPR